MIRIEELELTRADITGVSPLNPRYAEAENTGAHSPDTPAASAPDAGIEPLVSSIAAQGLIQPLIVWNRDGRAEGPFEVLNGGRRWRALADPRCAHIATINATLIVGSESEATSVALSSQRLQEPLHPVDEYEAFAALADAGMDEETIARQQGLTLRHVRQRMALGRIDDRFRALFRHGAITREIATVLAQASPEQQGELLADWDHRAAHWHLRDFRRYLRADRMETSHPLARFVTLAAYVAAGGAVSEDLFEETGWIEQPALLRKLAQDLCEAMGAAVCQTEGWGFFRVSGIAGTPGDFDYPDDAVMDLLETEQQALDDANRALNALDAANPENHGRARQLFTEAEAIMARGFGRAITKEGRAGRGVLVEPGHLPGIFEIGRAIVLDRWQDTDQDEGSSDVFGGAPVPQKLDGVLPVPGQAVENTADAKAPGPSRKRLDEIARVKIEALRAMVQRDSFLAESIVVLAMGQSDLVWGMISLRPPHELLNNPSSPDLVRDFAAADDLADCFSMLHEGDTGTSALFSQLVAAGLTLSGNPSIQVLDAVLTYAARMTSVDNGRSAILAAFDPVEWFATAGKQAKTEAIEALRCCAGDEAAARGEKASKAAAIAMAVQAASDTQWLPPALSGWLETGQETGEENDGSRGGKPEENDRSRAGVPPPPPEPALDLTEKQQRLMTGTAGKRDTYTEEEKQELVVIGLRRFLDAAIDSTAIRIETADRGDGVKTSKLHAVFAASPHYPMGVHCNARDTAIAVRAIGYETHRRNTGVYVLGIALTDGDGSTP